ncbi:hypothetical protein ISCGN_024928 [Ixodes scapularis]
MEVIVSSTGPSIIKGSVDATSLGPSRSREGNVSACPSGGGQAQHVRLSDNQRKSGHPDEVASSNNQEIPSDEKMDETSPLSDNDLLLPGAETLSSASGVTTEQQKDNAREKLNIPRVLPPKKKKKMNMYSFLLIRRLDLKIH